jgi:hypothetical protein
MTSSRVPGTRPARPMYGLQGVEGDGLCCGQIVLGNEGAKRVEILDCLRRPLNLHVVGRLGLGRSFLPFHELTSL